jgi:hypothetical protein
MQINNADFAGEQKSGPEENNTELSAITDSSLCATNPESIFMFEHL